MKKPSANERRLAKLLRDYDARPITGDEYDELAAFLASRGVLAVSAKTVPNDDCRELVSYYPTLCAPLVRQTLRRLARGAS